MRRPDLLPQIEPSPDPSEDTLLGSLGDLIEDGQTLIEAEFDLLRKQLTYGLASSKAIAGLVLLGLALLFFALMALIVGLLLALAPLLSAWGALGAVLGGILTTAAASFLFAFLKFRSAKSAILGSRDDHKGGQT